MKHIELTRNFSAVVDDRWHKKLAQHKWCYNNGYAARRMPGCGKTGQHLYMHRVICPTDADNLVIHLDGDKLNNQKSNLAIRARSHRSQAVATRAASGFRGVSYHHGRWVAQISIAKKNKHLGRFDDKITAALAYDKAARKAYGKSATLNFPAGMNAKSVKAANQETQTEVANGACEWCRAGDAIGWSLLCQDCIVGQNEWNRIDKLQESRFCKLPSGLRGFCCPQHGPIRWGVLDDDVVDQCSNCAAARHVYFFLKQWQPQ